MFNLLKWIESDSPSPLMLTIPPYAQGMEPDPEVVEKREQQVARLIEQMGTRWAGHPEYSKNHTFK